MVSAAEESNKFTVTFTVQSEAEELFVVAEKTRFVN